MNHIRPDSAAYACSYVPVEIIMAAGLSPRRLFPKGRCSEADSRIHPNTCCYIRSMLADLLEGSMSGISTMIFTNSCDGMRKLFDIWNDTEDKPDAVFLDLPKKNDPDSIQYFASVLRKFADKLQKISTRPEITQESLNRSIREINSVRSMMKKVFDLQSAPDSPLRGTDVFPLLLETDHEALMKSSDSILSPYPRNSGHKPSGRSPRLLLSGTVLNNPSIPEMIEDCGAGISAFDTCFGLRHYELPVEEETDDPFAAIAERYLRRPPCARMDGIGNQTTYLLHLAEELNADGVILSNVKYCDHMLFSIPMLRDVLKENGFPVLVIENDYEWSDQEKTRLNVSAFLETI